ncbi:hypothetical protein AA0472_0080 [Acetobacter estunensis NRIC 0472]|uniref:DUF1049 domain-containing protein n=1 Tax=Acetobacter estunensis TaxID=104097 RepID=A0A967B6D9_9PROT|nr:LapA family protein [Acetobacter estunensis]NHO53728.1 DUF1049 domain-containing protein [Acetobacter estunensis]GBQ20232.1 hypothetical protein AA0472_0080 [Acetobacter estunensis NRIC 0472]
MIRLILLVPLLLVVILFAASNQESTQMWLLTYSWSSSIGVMALLISVISLAMGALCMWFSAFGQGRRARKAEARVKELEGTVAAQVTELNRLRGLVNVDPSVTPHPTAPISPVSTIPPQPIA